MGKGRNPSTNCGIPVIYLTFVPHHCDCYVTHFKGHLEIYALPSCCQHQQQDLISPLKNVFEKIKRYQYKSCSQLFGTSIAFLQLIISLFF